MKIVGPSFVILAILNLHSSPSLGSPCAPPTCIRVASIDHQPFLSNGDGYIKDLLDALNIGTYQFRKPPDLRYGTERPIGSGQWNGMIGMLMENPPTADMIAADLTITPKRSEVLEFTMPFMSVPVTILLKKTAGGHRHRYHSVHEMLERNDVSFMTGFGGSTYHMLKDSNVPHLKKIFGRTNQTFRRIDEGVKRLIEANDQNFGLIIEAAAADYHKSQNCELYSVGNIGERFYGLAFPAPCQGCPSRTPSVSKEILKLHESGKLIELKEKWFGNNGTCHGQHQRHQFGRGLSLDGPCASLSIGLTDIKNELSFLRHEIRSVHNTGNTTIREPRIQTECCFRFGWGSRMAPCCLSAISCDEHDRLTAENQGAKQMPGGGWGKASVCPRHAAEAHQLWQQADQPPTIDVSDEGESCGYNFESNWSKKCKPGLRCDSLPNSDGESGTCVKEEAVEYDGYQKMPPSRNSFCEKRASTEWDNFDEAIERCNRDYRCVGVREIDEDCNGKGRIILCSSYRVNVSFESNVACGGYAKVLKCKYDSGTNCQ